MKTNPNASRKNIEIPGYRLELQITDGPLEGTFLTVGEVRRFVSVGSVVWFFLLARVPLVCLPFFGGVCFVGRKQSTQIGSLPMQEERKK